MVELPCLGIITRHRRIGLVVQRQIGAESRQVAVEQKAHQLIVGALAGDAVEYGVGGEQTVYLWRRTHHLALSYQAIMKEAIGQVARARDRIDRQHRRYGIRTLQPLCHHERLTIATLVNQILHPCPLMKLSVIIAQESYEEKHEGKGAQVDPE